MAGNKRVYTSIWEYRVLTIYILNFVKKYLIVILGQPNYCPGQPAPYPDIRRRARNVAVHPKYGGMNSEGTSEKIPIYDFALIEVDEIMWPFHTNMKPICLPFHWMWGDRQVLLE